MIYCLPSQQCELVLHGPFILAQPLLVPSDLREICEDWIVLSHIEKYCSTPKALPVTAEWLSAVLHQEFLTWPILGASVPLICLLSSWSLLKSSTCLRTASTQ